MASVHRKLQPVETADHAVARPHVAMTLPLLLERGPLLLLLRASRPPTDTKSSAEIAQARDPQNGAPCPVDCTCRSMSAAEQLLLLRDLVHELLRLQLAMMAASAVEEARLPP